VQLESFFNDFDNTITRVLHFLQFPAAQIPAMARPRPQSRHTAWSVRLTWWMELVNAHRVSALFTRY